MSIDTFRIYHGTSYIDVRRDEFPAEFDFDNPIEFTQKLMASVSRASGGFRMNGIRLSISREHGWASIIADGIEIVYRDAARHPTNLAALAAMLNEREKYHLPSIQG